MQRRSRKSRSSAAAAPSSHRNGSGVVAAYDEDHTGKSKPLFPKSALFAVFGCFLLVGFADQYRRVRHRRRSSSSSDRIGGATSIVGMHWKETAAESSKASKKADEVEAVVVGFAPEEDEALLVDSTGSSLHVVFSTDCGSFQHWQSYLLFHSAMKVRQTGRVTRIASGCDDEQRLQAQSWFDEHVGIMSKRFSVHFTPHFSSVTKDDGTKGGEYKFFNKPYGLRHWMEHDRNLGYDPSTDAVSNEDTIVILVDPDMSFLRPIVNDFSHAGRDILSARTPADKRKTKVVHGSPFAQKYGLGAGWQKFDVGTITSSATSPALSLSKQEAGIYYPAGPPYMATARDMHSIAVKWTEFVPKVHHEYPNLLAEMYAYCIAAAHLELPHQLVDSIMVSNTGAGGEGWPLVDSVPSDDVCKVAASPTRNNEPHYPLPNVVHFCQRYAMGDRYFFAKRKVPHDFFSCGSPLLAVPPDDLASTYDYKQPPGGKPNKPQEKKPLTTKEAKRETFVICAAIGALNDASVFFKTNHCRGSMRKIKNLQKSLNLRDLFP